MMPIRKITIHKFRGLVNQEFKPNGKRINAIVGQNGSMKTTILGLIAASFSIKSNPMAEDNTVDQKTFNTVLTSRFQFSEKYDIPGDHSWTVQVNDRIREEDVKLKSYSRSKEKLRFWIEGDRQKGTSLIQCPVIFLSLGRLTPLGELSKLLISPELLTDEEISLFCKWHNTILSSLDSIKSADVIRAAGKTGTVGANTDYYDSSTISAGQDNVGTVILAVLSMKRLKEKYTNNYLGGIICIDELESTLYPAAQLHMIDFLKEVSDKYQIQFFVTTHSMTIIRALLRKEMEEYVSVTYAKRIGKNVELRTDCSLEQIENDLFVRLGKRYPNDRVKVYCEDVVGMEFAKALIGRKYTQKDHLDYQNKDGMNLGYTNYKTLVEHKIPEFLHSVIVLDGDVRNKPEYKQLQKYKNIVILPGITYPERIVFNYLQNLPEDDSFWCNEVGGYSKQTCFDGYSSTDLQETDIKNWFKKQKTDFDQSFSKLLKCAISGMDKEIICFLEDFEDAYNYVKSVMI